MLFRRVSRVDDAATVSPVDRDEFRYREGDHVLLFTAELLNGEPQRAIYQSTIDRWLPPHDGEPMADARRAAVLAKIQTYFRNNHQSCVVVP